MMILLFNEFDTHLVLFRHNDISLSVFVIPGLTRNPVFFWVLAGLLPHTRHGVGMACPAAMSDIAYSKIASGRTK